MCIPNTVCVFYPMSLKWVLQSSDQELGKHCLKKAADICALVFALPGYYTL